MTVHGTSGQPDTDCTFTPTAAAGPKCMGAVLSSKKKKTGEAKWSWSGPPGDHSPYPVDYVPFPGPGLLYCFVDIMTSFRIMRNVVNLGPRVTTTNVEDFWEEFEDCYSEGFSLNQFVKIPCVRSTTTVQNWGERQPYQAIFSKYEDSSQACSKDTWVIKVEKRILSTRTLSTIDVGEGSDLMSSIKQQAALGGRLVCAEPIGFVRSEGTTNEQYSVMGVDLFFNMPRHLNPIKYTYHAIRVPARYIVLPDSSQSVQQIQCDADWMGQLKVFLDDGWKLVDICMDTTTLADAFGMKCASKSIDTVWIFEKEEAKLEDMRAQFEGVIIEYKHKVKNTLDGEVPCRDWRPVIAGMGVNGWELATIIQTPILVQSSFTTYTMKLLMFFQRRIIAEHRTQIAEYIRAHTQTLKARKQRRLMQGLSPGYTLSGADSRRPHHQSMGLNQEGRQVARPSSLQGIQDAGRLSAMQNTGGGSLLVIHEDRPQEYYFDDVLKRFMPLEPEPPPPLSPPPLPHPPPLHALPPNQQYPLGGENTPNGYIPGMMERPGAFMDLGNRLPPQGGYR